MKRRQVKRNKGQAVKPNCGCLSNMAKSQQFKSVSEMSDSESVPENFSLFKKSLSAVKNLFYVHFTCRTWNKNKYVDCAYGSFQRNETPVALEVGGLVEKCINIFVVSHCFMCERSDTGAFYIPPHPKSVLPPCLLSWKSR